MHDTTSKTNALGWQAQKDLPWAQGRRTTDPNPLAAGNTCLLPAAKAFRQKLVALDPVELLRAELQQPLDYPFFAESFSHPLGEFTLPTGQSSHISPMAP